MEKSASSRQLINASAVSGAELFKSSTSSSKSECLLNYVNIWTKTLMNHFCYCDSRRIFMKFSCEILILLFSAFQMGKKKFCFKIYECFMVSWLSLVFRVWNEKIQIWSSFKANFKVLLLSDATVKALKSRLISNDG
jgi:hypothetical protein